MKKLLLLLMWCSPVSAFAQGFQVNLGGQKQIAMGHTGTGLLQDGASVFFNPGAVAMLPSNSVQAGISPLWFKSTFNPTGSNAQYSVKNRVATPFNAYAIWGPKSAAWKLGLGVYTPFGGLTDWGHEWTGRYALESLDLKAIFIQPTISVKLADFLSIGAGFVYNHASVDLQRAIPLADANGNPGQARLNGTGKGYGWNAGVFFKTESGVNVGVSYRSKVKTNIDKGDAIFTVPSSLQTSFPQPNTFSSGIPLPATLSLGLGYPVSKKWLVAFDANLVGWSSYKALAFDYATNTTNLQDTYSPRNYKNAYALRAGAEYKGIEKVALRFGGGYASTAVRDGYVTPEVPDANRWYATAGVGAKLTKQLDLDFSFEYEHLYKRTQTNIETQLSGTFQSNVYIPGISLTYHW
ncbi:long-chain fatty acid transporter [Mucilaginibacter terrenus]|uniref:Long-chain fatty acid transporter n=1 Tax=Mucilaginibacter terrenus TaxID=2482727 RepID=A0A3E2NMQ0_9SPHI|nr:outer membrane protein transport protein [Mucilaginibacter terrenus]RFZ82258.1 long-chain fatty acid transporter [Mucilaginibacter terrenus]